MLALVLTSPAWIVAPAAQSRLMGRAWQRALIFIMWASPGLALFWASRDADASTNAAGYVVAPLVSVRWGLPRSLTFLFAKRP